MTSLVPHTFFLTKAHHRNLKGPHRITGAPFSFHNDFYFLFEYDLSFALKKSMPKKPWNHTLILHSSFNVKKKNIIITIYWIMLSESSLHAEKLLRARHLCDASLSYDYKQLKRYSGDDAFPYKSRTHLIQLFL